MKSAVLYGKCDLRVEDFPVPSVGPRQVLIRVKACGVCGTDVHIFHGDKGSADITPPIILGHELAGVITEVGVEVTKYHVGDRVCIDPSYCCDTCEFCRRGEAHYCPERRGYGSRMNGGFAQFCAVHERQLYRLGENTTFEQGAMAEPVACCLHGIDLCGIKAGHQVLVIGGGMIGLIMVQLARLAGAAKVALIATGEGQRAMGRKLGADVCIDPAAQDAAAVLRESGMHWVNTVIECVGKPETVLQAIDLAGRGATVMIFGLTKPDETVPINPFLMFRKELTLKTSFINPYTQQRALDLIDSGRLDVTSMVCPPRPLEDLAEILASREVRRKGKYIISPEL